MRALASRVNNEHVRIADKISDIYVPHPEKLGTVTVQKYQHEPYNQVVDLSSCFDLSNKEDCNKAVDSLRKKPRLAVFKARLPDAIDEPKRLEHLDRVVELAKMQHNNHRGFIVISESLNNEVKESNSILEEKFSGLGFKRLGIGMCSDGLIVNGNLESQLITKIYEVSTSLKPCNAQVETKRSIDSM